MKEKPPAVEQVPWSLHDPEADVIDVRSEVFSPEQRARTQALYHVKELIGQCSNPVSQYRELARWIVDGDEVASA